VWDGGERRLLGDAGHRWGDCALQSAADTQSGGRTPTRCMTAGSGRRHVPGCG
jgi:hypothetical protein